MAVPGLLVAVAMLAVVACGDGFQPGVPAPATQPDPAVVDLQADATAAQAPSPSGAQSGGELTATDNGLTMAVTLSSSDVAPGGSLAIHVTVRNDRPVPVVLGPGVCGAPATMYGRLPVPLDPTGRDWDGLAATFKTYALTEGLREGGAPMSAPGWVYAATEPCRDDVADVTLQPGGSVSGIMTWSAVLVQGVPALPGEVRYSVTVSHDPTGEPPSYPPDYKGPMASWSRMYEQLMVDGAFRITGDAPAVLTAGQAIDAMLATDGFAAWLTEEPPSTWSGANVFLQNPGQAQGIVPAGPSWEIDLFRETGVPRNWAIGFVDAYSGKVLNLTFCNAPCDR